MSNNGTDVKNNIFYRPELDIERDYSTTGSVTKTSTTDSGSSNTRTTELEDYLTRAEKTQDDLLQIRKVIDLLPDKTATIIKDLVDKLIFQGEDEKEKIKEIIKQDKKDDEENVRRDEYKSNPDSRSPGETVLDDGQITFWKDPEPLDLTITVVKTKDLGELAYEQYLKDSTALKEDFAYKLNSVMQDYIYPLITVMGEIGLDSKTYLTLDYEGESITGVKDDDKHLHDAIVKNQTIIDEKNRKFAKTHSANNSLAVMTAFDITSQQRVKYYKEEYDMGLNSFAGIYKRNLLEQSRKEYENKYAKAKINMYKYLNSSAVVTGDILKRTLEVDTSKCYLLANDVNIYARKRYEATGYQNTTDDTMTDLTKDADSTASTTNNTSKTSNNSNTTNKNSNSTSESGNKTTEKSSSSKDISNAVKSTTSSVLDKVKDSKNNTVNNAKTTEMKVSTKNEETNNTIKSTIDDTFGALNKKLFNK